MAILKTEPRHYIRSPSWPQKDSAIVVIQNSANVGFPHLMLGYKQTFTAIALQCTDIHNSDQHVWFIYYSLGAIPQGIVGKNLNILHSGVTLIICYFSKKYSDSAFHIFKPFKCL